MPVNRFAGLPSEIVAGAVYGVVTTQIYSVLGMRLLSPKQRNCDIYCIRMMLYTRWACSSSRELQEYWICYHFDNVLQDFVLELNKCRENLHYPFFFSYFTYFTLCSGKWNYLIYHIHYATFIMKLHFQRVRFMLFIFFYLFPVTVIHIEYSKHRCHVTSLPCYLHSLMTSCDTQTDMKMLRKSA